MPIDPSSGGTWIGANDAGLVICLLNGNPPRARPSATRKLESRGVIVPRLLANGDLATAAQRALDLEPTRFPEFRLLITDGCTHCIVTSDGMAIDCVRYSVAREPLLLTSSGLGDHVVQRPREALFKRMIGGHHDPLEAQRRFHSHTWKGREHVSVLMSRPDARTVSQTAIDLWPSGVILRHSLVDDDLRLATITSVCELASHRREGAVA